jgi:circadian clock protein KaiC
MVSAEHTMVDGLIELGDEAVDVRVHRTLTVRKFRGSASLRGKHSFRITKEGIQLYPRIEAWLDRPMQPDHGHGPKISTGSKSIDAMIEGGICGSSVTGVVGPTGAGKTLFALQFVAQSSKKEPGLFFSFYETPARLVKKAQAFGHDIEPLLKKGTLEVLWHSTGEHLLDELGHQLLRAVTARGVKRLAIDGLGGLLESVPDRNRIGRFMACLSNELRARDVTTVMTVESADIVGPTVKMPVAGVSAIIENLIFLRFVEHDAALSRLISITKMRNSEYDEHVRQLFITADGMQVGDPLYGWEGTVTGVATRSHGGTAVRSNRPAKKK